jgi:predicted kinase
MLLEKRNVRQTLMIVCGVPGAGKSTLARHAVNRWMAVSYASESFASQLGPAARDTAGDLTSQAIAHAYAAMAAAVKRSLKLHPLVLAAGSFRAEDQRRQFREIGALVGAQVITVLISCPAEIAASRVRARRADGENGPDEEAIRRISAELDCASDIDLVISNDASIELFHRRADAMMVNLSS